MIVAVRRRSVREGVFVAASSVAAFGAVLVPFAIASLSGTWRSLRIQFSGGLQIESLGSSLLVIASHVADKASDFTTHGA